MSNDLELFKGNPLVSGGLFDRFMKTTSKLVGGGGGNSRRISIRGNRFRLIVGGEQVSVSKEDTMNVIVIDAADIARTYYEGAYDPEKSAAPVCWSHDTQTPAPEVPEDQRKSARCADCPMNVKGSGQGNSRACRFSQRMAVMLEGDLEKVYQLQLPAASIFGQADGNKLPMQAYAKYLAEHQTPIQAVVTTMYFDENSESPKLFFKPARMINAEETQALAGHIDGEDVRKAITLTVSQVDKSEAKTSASEPEKPETKKAAPKAEKVVDATPDTDEVVVDEPTVATNKKTKPVEDEEPNKLGSLLSDWDD